MAESRHWVSGSGPLSLLRAHGAPRALFSGVASAGCGVESGLLFQPGLVGQAPGRAQAPGPDPKRGCHRSRLLRMAQVFGKCHGAGPFSPAACSLSAGLGFSVKFTVQANIDGILPWEWPLSRQRELGPPLSVSCLLGVSLSRAHSGSQTQGGPQGTLAGSHLGPQLWVQLAALSS